MTSFAIADLNGDQKDELYFTYSWGSGIHRSEVGYFDTATREVTLFDFRSLFTDLVFSAEDNHLQIHTATFDGSSFSEFEPTDETKLASIVFSDDEIMLVEEAQ